MVDYMIWPWMERLPSVSILSGGIMKVEMEKFPNLVSSQILFQLLEENYNDLIFLFPVKVV